MIKVTCKDGIESVKENYPCLKITKHRCLVLFTKPRTGYEVMTGISAPSPFVYHSETWAEEDFKPYTGTIELSNEL